MGGKIMTSSEWPTSHLFFCWVNNLTIVGIRIVFLFWTFDQESTSTAQLTRTKPSTPNKVWRVVLHYSHRRKHVSSNDVTSSYINIVSSCTSQMDGIIDLSTTYFLEWNPTHQIKSLAQNQNLWQNMGDPLAVHHNPS
jgi:hypothetical protein